FAVAFSVSTLASLDFLPALGITIPPVGPIAVVITLVIVNRTIRRFQLFDITPAFAAEKIVSAMREPLLVTDDEGIIRIVNEALCELSGYERAELLGMNVDTLIPDAATGDIELRRRQGRPIPISVSMSPLEEDGRQVGLVLIARDLRERRRIDAALREQDLQLRTETVRRTAELQYRTLVESMNEGLIQIDRENIIRYINQPAAMLSGRRAEDLIGASVFEFFGEEVRQTMVDKVRLREQGISDRYEVEIIAVDGTSRWVEVTGSPFYDSHGLPAGSLGIVTDITSRHLSQQQLAASARQWQDTFDAIQMPIVILDTQRHVQRANRAAAERAGPGAGERLALPVRDFGADGLWQEIDRLARSPERNARVQFGGPEKSETWDIVVDVVDQEGHENQMVVSAREITAIIELQESLRRSETLSALGELVGGVAHEVRNPLFAISSTLDAFEDTYRQHDEYRSFALTMRRQIDRLSGLMSGLLDFGRPVSSALTTVDVRTVVHEAISLCADDASVASVQVSLVAPDQPLNAFADPRRLAIAFRNIIHNALQFAPGESTVEVRLQHGQGENGTALIVCEVQDRGPGFEEPDLPYVFDPFFTRRVGGTGLGLSTTRVIIEQHAGTITAANAPEGGAVVRVELPSMKSEG
ncbi:MAG: PAS domain S-box protein, partial [Acidobacteriota bacterium]